MYMYDNPWTELNPNDFTSHWWNISLVNDTELYNQFKDVNQIICHLIIQDCI